MISDKRRELLRLLAELSEEAPDVRFGQLITNLSYLGRGLSTESVWDVEDEELLRAGPRTLGAMVHSQQDGRTIVTRGALVRLAARQRTHLRRCTVHGRPRAGTASCPSSWAVSTSTPPRRWLSTLKEQSHEI